MEKLDAAWLDLKSPVTPVMGGVLLWNHELRRKKESLKEKSEMSDKSLPVLVAETTPIEGFGTIVSTRTTVMAEGLAEAKIIAKKTSADIVDGFFDNIPNDGDEMRSAIRMNSLLKEMGALIRRHQVEKTNS